MHDAHHRQHLPSIIHPAAAAIHSHSYPGPEPPHVREAVTDAGASAGVHGRGGGGMHNTMTQGGG
jgi:hypothetical protein